MAVEVWMGHHGQGKTFLAVDHVTGLWLALLDRWAAGGRQGPAPALHSNVAIVGASKFDTWDELMASIEEAIVSRQRLIVLVDEAGVVLSSRFWSKLDPRVLEVLMQRRKMGGGVDLFLTLPNFARVDSLVRDITQLVHVCRRIGGSEYSHEGGRPPRAFTWRSYAPEDVGRPKAKPRGRGIVPFSPALAAAYETGLVRMGKPMADEVNARPDFYGDADRHQPAREVGITLTVDHQAGRKPRGRKPKTDR